MLVPGHDPIAAGSRRELVERITSLVSTGIGSSAIEVFRRVPVRITTTYEIEAQHP